MNKCGFGYKSNYHFITRAFCYLSLLLIIGLSSCQSVERLFTGLTDSDIEKNMILINAEEAVADIETIYLRRLNIDFKDRNNDRSFRANMFIERDSVIIISVIPVMGIELVRVMFDKSDIYIIDRINQEVSRSDYSTFSDRYNVTLDFHILQSIFTNSLFSYPLHEDYNFNDYNFSVEEKQYKFERKYLDSGCNVEHHFSVLPDIYKVNNFIIDYIIDNKTLEVDYSSFIKVDDDYVFPETIELKSDYRGRNHMIRMNFNSIVINGEQTIFFQIPDSYEVIDF
ncbi:DUF4292 domain-containing protein [Marinilabiliaceae bacterium ANBcel2]|nr:DUF4292 domain-containing protein [Marinilabiliaceae bacterium ANBcel2]